MSKSTLTRRALIASAAAVPAAAALALPAAAAAAPSDALDRAAIVARAEQLVELLRTRYITAGWPQLDEPRSARFLDSLRRLDFEDGDNEKMTTVLDWVSDHGQSLDWIYGGNPGGMICRLAAQSPRAATAVDPIFAAIEAHRAAEAAYEQACEAPGRIVGKYQPARVRIGDYTDGELSKSETDEHGGYTLTWTPTGTKSPSYVYSPADIERNIPRDLQGADRDVWVAQQLAELRKDERRIAKNHARTKLGKLEAIRDQARDRERDRMWDLIWTTPTTLNGLAALLRYNRENESTRDDEWEDALKWTMECAVCAFAGLPEPPMDDVVTFQTPAK